MKSPTELSETLDLAKSPDDAMRVLVEAYGVIDGIVRECVRSNNIQLACKEKCPLCCVFRVDARAHEVFLIASHIAKSLNDTQQDLLKQKLEEYTEKVRAMSYREHLATNITCPLLEDDICSIYPVRPIGCRRHHALDFEGCVYSYEHPEDLTFPGSFNITLKMTIAHAEAIVNQLFSTHQFDSTVYEFSSTLLLALDSNKFRHRWFDRKKAFPGALETT